MSFNGKSCTYDAMGNPTTYLGKSIMWIGKNLRIFDNIFFYYDGMGRRYRKDSVDFTYDSNGNLVQQSNGIKYFYNASGVAGLVYNGTRYHYSKDVQGNIIAILDSTGKVVVQYWYDAWGNHKVVDGNGNEITDQTHIGNINPFRYRGYYYDVETGLYYLQTRYYDPEVGRFISRDSIEYADPETVHGLNLYAYCLNNPIAYTDPTGTTEWWEWLLGGLIVAGLVVGAVVATVLTGGAVAAMLAGAAIGGAISYGTQAISGELNWGQFALDIGVGALTGLIGASGVSRTTATVLGGLIGSGSSIASDLINGKPINYVKALIGGLIGVASGYLGGAGVRNVQGLSSSIYKGFSNNMTVGIINNLINNAPKYLLTIQNTMFKSAMFWYATGTLGNSLINLGI